MRYYKVNGIEHQVFDPHDDIDIHFRKDWKDGTIGEWVLADDECVIQILRRGKMLTSKGKNRTKEYVGTCTGTFPVSDAVKMDTSRRHNIYSFSGELKSDEVLESRADLNKGEILFVQYMSAGMAPREAYLKSFPTNNPGYANMRATKLIKTERIRTAMKEELKPICEELGIDEKFVLTGIKTEAETADKPDTRLKALFKLSDIMDLEDKNQTKVTQISGAVFKGFSDDLLNEAKRPDQIGSGGTDNS